MGVRSKMSQMSPENEVEPEDAVVEETPAPPAVPVLPNVEASVWRLSPAGFLVSSVIEAHVGTIAELEPNTIFFYAELGNSTELKNDDETMQKVYKALASVGMSEGQIINATSAMQSAGILFRERAV